MAHYNLANFMRTHSPRNGEFFTVAIDGRGGSGKSSLGDYLAVNQPAMTMLQGDDYFEPIEDAILWGEFNNERFIRDVITPLQQGQTFMYQPYDWNAEPHITEQAFTVQKIFCLERCYSFGFELDWDLRIWVETPKNICLGRGITRDNGLGEERASNAWKIWQEREDIYIEKTNPRHLANWVIDGTIPFENQIALQ